VLVGAGTGRQNLGDVGVGQGRKTPVDTTGRRGAPVGAHITQGIDKGKDAVFVIKQHLLVVTGLYVAKRHGRTVGKAQGKYSRRNIRSERIDPGIPADLHAGLDQLIGDGGVILVGCQKNIKAAPLVVFDDILGYFSIWCRTDDGRKARGRAVDEFNASFTEHSVVRSAQPDLAGVFIDIFGMEVEIRFGEIPDGLLDFKGKERRHAGIQQGPQIGQVVGAFDMRRQQFSGEFQRFFDIFKGFDLNAQQGIDHRQKIGRVGKSNLGIGIKGFQSAFIFPFDL